jgi:hypothetical protein
MTTDHEMRMEALKLFEENQALRGRLKAIVHTVGGTVEGHPTHEINILQRLRQLVEIEKRSS